MLNKYMNGIKVLMIREGEKRKKMDFLWDWEEKENKSERVKRPENIE